MTIRFILLTGILALLIGVSSISVGQPAQLPRLAMSDARGNSVSDPEHRFTGFPLAVEYIDGRVWEVLHDVSYRTQGGEIIHIRTGFIMDFAAIPRCFFWALPPAGSGENVYGIAAMFHDRLYTRHRIGKRPITRHEADDIFLEIMRYTKVDWIVADTMYGAVVCFGWTHW